MEDRKASLRTGPMRRRIARAVARFLVSIPEVKDSLEEAAAHAVTYAMRDVDREIGESVEHAIEDSNIRRTVEQEIEDCEVQDTIDEAVKESVRVAMDQAGEDIDLMVRDAMAVAQQAKSIEQEQKEEERLRALIMSIVKDNVASFFVNLMEATSRKEK